MHQSVLLDEVLDAFGFVSGGTAAGVYIDCTFGYGGHAGAILDALAADARLIGIDRDAEALAAARPDPRLELVHAGFSRLPEILASRAPVAGVQGILMDLGVSSPQLDASERGFSFRDDGPLDMRMDRAGGETAAQWLQRVSERELRECLFALGEERFSSRIARRIVGERDRQPLQTTGELAALVAAAYPAPARRKSRIHPATRTFQAIRMRINDELEELGAALDAGTRALAPGGRMVVIAFHSLEDRMVKRHFRAVAAPRSPYDDEPVGGVDPVMAEREYRLLTRKPVRPGEPELERNPRARSARLRALERVQ